ncbi:hypothetical protein PF005_g448 [Phytophthora fragariae]|uniref:Uncharacterized protein n=1 Tax=Phytophthora fragariae TaxID=53985 RepID=A0A6A3TQ00_9STRA|nr:hypothetical protein PF009_g489 [Phytophthora fragariae]KAE9140974.1 hypothetical protein PF007_g454 [Phytophthora fragariae]KAE9155789.1 hypothetical protein PF006_g323 [Phytophthora fragariae]KAE9237984.1 hypothetical protein PF005_g448 [Phytophthora fragariae]KAE9258124.1 hypothetical protein PF002_g419 [Phytophthora fragariae]
MGGGTQRRRLLAACAAVGCSNELYTKPDVDSKKVHTVVVGIYSSSCIANTGFCMSAGSSTLTSIPSSLTRPESRARAALL